MKFEQAEAAVDASRELFPPHGFVGWLINSVLMRKQSRGRHRRMELLETLSLGGRRQLMLVVCDGERFLVGVSGDAVQSIVGCRGELRQSQGPWEQDGL